MKIARMRVVKTRKYSHTRTPYLWRYLVMKMFAFHCRLTKTYTTKNQKGSPIGFCQPRIWWLGWAKINYVNTISFEWFWMDTRSDDQSAFEKFNLSFKNFETYTYLSLPRVIYFFKADLNIFSIFGDLTKYANFYETCSDGCGWHLVYLNVGEKEFRLGKLHRLKILRSRYRRTA